MSGTKSFPADNVKLHISSAADAPTGTMTVLMRTNRYYTDGSLLQTGEEYTVTKEWGQDALSRNWCEDVADVFPETETPSGLTAAQVAVTQALVSGDGIVVHPNLWHQSFAGLAVADDAAVQDISGNGRHATRGANLSLVQLHAAPGYYSTVLAGTNGHNTTLEMPSINFDYDGGEILLVVVLFKGTAPAADGVLVGNSASASYNGFRFRTRTTGFVDFGLYSTTGAVTSLSGNSIASLLDGNLQQIAVLINGRAKTRSMWENAGLTRDNQAGPATCDTRESVPLRIGGVPPMTSTTHTSAQTVRALTIMRWGPTDTAPTDAAITTLLGRLRANPARPVVKGEV